jgi:hypothetical protein
MLKEKERRNGEELNVIYRTYTKGHHLPSYIVILSLIISFATQAGYLACLRVQLLFPPNYNGRSTHEENFTAPRGSRANERGKGTGHEDLHSPFNLFRVVIHQEFLDLLLTALLIFWVLHQIAQDPGETMAVVSWPD